MAFWWYNIGIIETIARTNEVDIAVSALTGVAYELIEAKYGPEGDSPKEYHNLDHAIDVVSADLAVQHMRTTGLFSPDDEVAVRDMIMATEVHFASDGKMDQSATADYRTQIVADADLATIGFARLKQRNCFPINKLTCSTCGI